MSSDPRDPPIKGFFDDGMVPAHRTMLLGAFKEAGWPQVERLAARTGAPIAETAYAVVRQRDAYLEQQARAADRAAAIALRQIDCAENELRHQRTQHVAWIGAVAGVVGALVAILALMLAQ